MNEQSRKWTRGPWRVEPDVRTPPNEPAYIAGYDVVSDHGTIIGNEGICCGEHDEANATLIAEAGTVANETGLTPRQLAEALRECVELLADVMDYRGGAANALADEYVTERLFDFYTKHAALRSNSLP